MCAKKVKAPQTDDMKEHPFTRFISGNVLNLSNQSLTDAHIPELSRFLLDHPELTHLDLSLNHIGDQGLADFTERNLCILYVNLEGNNISDNGLAVFAYMNQIITQVNFSHNRISDKGIQDFVVKNQTCMTSRFSTLHYH